jgi:hypothetical protein
MFTDATTYRQMSEIVANGGDPTFPRTSMARGRPGRTNALYAA